MRLATVTEFAFLYSLVVSSLACSGGGGSPGAPEAVGQSAQGGSASSGTALSGGHTSSGGTGGTSVVVVGSGGAVTGAGGVGNTGGASVVGSGGALGGGTTVGGGANTGGRSSGSGGTLIGSGGAVLSTGGTLGVGGASGSSSGGTGGSKTSSGGGGGTTLATGGNAGNGASTATGGRVGTGGTSGTSGTAGSGGSATGSVTIVPGAVWNDTQGNVIQAHGEGIIKVAGTYYWLGEDKTNGSPFQNIKCYSSTDLKNWTFVSNALTRTTSGDLGPNRIVERPHVIYNNATSQFVMYMHIDNSSYTDRKTGVATCNSVCGSYTYRGSVKPLGHDSLDDTLFQDGATGYFLSEDRTNAKLQIYQLSEDYLSISSLVATLPQFESPAVAKIGSTYFIFGSHLTGWSTNDNQYTTATSMAGPWAAWKSFAPSGTNTCNSQVTFILPVVGTSTTTYLFLGDRWNSNNLTDSRYVWQPLTISGTTVSMTCATSWKIDASTGIWSP